MSEKFSSSTATGVATGTNKTAINMFASAATPISRLGIFELECSSVATPADQSAKMSGGRTTAVGTEGSGYTPVNLDPAGPAGAADAGIGTFTAEPTYTSNKAVLIFSLNQRATFRWIAREGCELYGAATQNNGIGFKSASSTSTQAYEWTVFHQE